jgi:hypothetical protein
MSVYPTANDLSVTSVLSPYSKFKMALKSKEVKRQYPNLLEKFLDFCKLCTRIVESDETLRSLLSNIEDLNIRLIEEQNGTP